MSKARFHVRPSRCIERLAGRAQHVSNDRRRYPVNRWSRINTAGLQHITDARLLPSAVGAATLACACPLRRGFRHTYHPVGDVAGLFLVDISRITNRQLGLQGGKRLAADGYPAEIMTEALNGKRP
jgi:hypothetical protein